MELRHLKYFVAVAEELHFRRAAEKLHVAQPAVSEQVRKLEAELGVPLFTRSSRQVRLTDAGEVLLREARTVLRNVDVAVDSVRQTREAARSRARVGYGPYGLPGAVARTLARLWSGPSRMHYELAVGDPRRLLVDVRQGVLDAAVVTLPAPLSGLRTFAVGAQATVAAVRGGARVPAGPLALETLAGARLVTLPRTSDPSFHDALVAGFRRHELWAELNQSRAETVDQLLLEVSGGSGIALLPESVTLRGAPAGITFRAVPVSTRAVIVTRDEAPVPALAALVDAVGACAETRVLAAA